MSLNVLLNCLKDKILWYREGKQKNLEVKMIKLGKGKKEIANW